MKRSEVKKLSNRTKADLKKALIESKEELRSLRFDLSAGKVKNIQKAREVKKKIARILTFIQEKRKTDK
ncbi:MAG: 50S ribosomal protein L29 [Candidatus Colwellbacteria bacterium CG10_big_fil_rev_8_21_14_0_10_42_22]|uniref:Large ribosomal subunit protein uL29 n=1 Tax=Candidatus Colwellbacteria bacterium CG10_big_fil_rev_8_21_14_0_10_42_22 TaxID=1974540 RepID=A0A2H0VFC3_9BACT|nr:MAG: 50S ribosomal protein L29 [Candidatus Colwellbacteria bacterium CG10_big_fil_rev_8_21_14_0_10_42_22]